MDDLAIALTEGQVDWATVRSPVTPVTGLPVVRARRSRHGKVAEVIARLPQPTFATDDAIGIAADEWLLFGSAGEAIAQELRDGGHPSVEMSAGLVILSTALDSSDWSRLTGLAAQNLAIGRAAMTRVAGIRVTLHSHSEGMRMIFDRSCDRHVRRWLDAAN